MAHFAKIGMNGKVLQVLTLDNINMLNADGIEDESVGQQYLEQHHNWASQMWIQTSYNTYQNNHYNGGTPFRGNFASVGYIWDEENQLFFPPKPYPSWIKNITNAKWDCPIGDAPVLTQEQLDNNYYYQWNEDNQSWDLTNN